MDSQKMQMCLGYPPPLVSSASVENLLDRAVHSRDLNLMELDALAELMADWPLRDDVFKMGFWVEPLVKTTAAEVFVVRDGLREIFNRG